MKATLVAFPLYLLVAVLLVDNGAAQERAIRIGFPSVAFQELPLFAASKRGFFRAEGLNVELIQIAGSPAVAALLSGDVDYITHNSRIIATAARGGGVKSLFNYVAKPIYYLVTLPEIKQAKELQGRTVAVSSFGGAAHYITRQLLEFYGLSVPRMSPFERLDRTPYVFPHWSDGPSMRRSCRPILPCDLKSRDSRVGLRGGHRRHAHGGLGTTEKGSGRSATKRGSCAPCSMRPFVNDDREERKRY
jgi:hypothetical protein